MEISSAHHQQVMSSHALEEVLGSYPKSTQQQQQQQEERKPRPQPEQALRRCPRCDSTNTKFCYYNNYSLSQPRYFCKGCRRYWTQGGSLRNVPVGGGCRKNKRPSSSSTSSSSKKASQDQALINTTTNHSLPPALPLLSYDPSDLSLAFARHEPFLLGNYNPNHPHIPTPPTGSGFLDILRNGFLHDSTTTTTTVLTNPEGFHNFYYGFGSNGKVEDVEEELLPFDESLGVSAAEDGGSHGSSCKSMDDGGNKLLMGLQWQLGGDGNSMGVDSSRDYWNGVGSSWHSLINSSLM